MRESHSAMIAEVTDLLAAWRSGEPRAEGRLFESVYPELRRLANRRLREERAWSVQATELANEAYLRLIDQRHTDWQSRAHFYAIAATMIRRILVDRARHRLRHKRGAGAAHVPLDQVDLATSESAYELLDLDLALTLLAAVDPSASRIVELRFFGGLEVAETAAVLGVSRATVIRRWRFARAWLAERLAP